jgi:catechol 2,3-dioxygenase-like lactoylglutathione lyase family enzyme
MEPTRARPIDHVVVAVRDLDAAAATYEQLGFTLTPPARHPFGTGNRLVQLGDCFIELLAVVDPALIPEPTPRFFSFAAFNRDWIARHGEGGSMLVLRSDDADADRAAFAALGLATYDRVDFGRSARQPDGSVREVGFSLAMTTSPLLPECGFFTCYNRFPENFWTPAFQAHANAALGLAEVVLVSLDPADHAEFLGGFAGVRNLAMTSFALDVPTPNGRISVLSPQGWAARYGGPLPIDPLDGARLAALRFRVGDLAAMRQRLGWIGVPTRMMGEALVIDAEHAHGVTLAFVQDA